MWVWVKMKPLGDRGFIWSFIPYKCFNMVCPSKKSRMPRLKWWSAQVKTSRSSCSLSALASASCSFRRRSTSKPSSTSRSSWCWTSSGPKRTHPLNASTKRGHDEKNAGKPKKNQGKTQEPTQNMVAKTKEGDTKRSPKKVDSSHWL